MGEIAAENDAAPKGTTRSSVLRRRAFFVYQGVETNGRETNQRTRSFEARFRSKLGKSNQLRS